MSRAWRMGGPTIRCSTRNFLQAPERAALFLHLITLMQSRDTVSRNPRYRPFRAACSGPEFGAPFVASRCCPAAEQFRGRRDQKGPGRARICFGPQSTVAVRSGSWRESNAPRVSCNTQSSRPDRQAGQAGRNSSGCAGVDSPSSNLMGALGTSHQVPPIEEGLGRGSPRPLMSGRLAGRTYA